MDKFCKPPSFIERINNYRALVLMMLFSNSMGHYLLISFLQAIQINKKESLKSIHFSNSTGH